MTQQPKRNCETCVHAALKESDHPCAQCIRSWSYGEGLTGYRPVPNAFPAPVEQAAPSALKQAADFQRACKLLPAGVSWGDAITPAIVLQIVPEQQAAQPVATVKDGLTVAQPVAQEPVAWRYIPSAAWRDYVLTEERELADLARQHGCNVEPLYTAAPSPVALTDEQIDAAINAWFEQEEFPKEAGPQFRRRMRLAFSAVGIQAGKAEHPGGAHG